jgi:hypothetical protein
MTLLAEAEISDEQTQYSRADDYEQSALENEDVRTLELSIDESTPKRTTRTNQSRPQLDEDKRRRRHFSFEPGEDQVRAWNAEVIAGDISRAYGNVSDPVSSIFDKLGKESVELATQGSASPYQIPNVELYNASKIPSPIQVFGSVRREASISSLQSSQPRSNDGRHNSQSSILTAYRENQNASLQAASSSGSSSNNNLRDTHGSPSPKDRPGTAFSRINVAHTVPGQNTDHTQHTAKSRGVSPANSIAKSFVTSSSLRIIHNMGSHVPEDNESYKVVE